MAVVLVVASVVGWAAPAGAATTVQWSGVSGTIDCSTLQSGYYHAVHVAASVAGLPPATQYTARVYSSAQNTIGVDIPITTDAQGSAVIDASLSGSVVSGRAYNLTLWSGQSLAARHALPTNTCASGVTPTGKLSADAVCPTRYLSSYGDVQDTAYRVHGTMTGFVPGETYTLATDYTAGSPSAVADPSGAVAFDVVVGGPLLWTGTHIGTTSQLQSIGSALWDIADPCPAMKASYPAGRPTESDVNGDGMSDLLAIDLSGRLLYYKNASWQNPGGLPFTTSQTIGSGWGPQYRIESTGDLTGDGYAELVTIRSDGALVAYYNNMNSNPGRVPYTAGTLIGSGWQSFTGFTLGDVNHDGFADLIAERSDGTYWLYTNHYLSNPGHLPFSSGVRMAAPGFESAIGFAAVDSNTDGYADLWSYAGWLNPNLLPAGNSQPFGSYLSVEQNSLSNLGAFPPQAGWAVGHYNNSTVVPGVVAANPNGDGSLMYFEDLGGSGWPPPKVIGSGWRSIRQIIS